LGSVLAIGEATHVEGFALAGAATISAEDPDSVRRAWEGLDEEVAVVILTQRAAAALGDRQEGGPVLCVVMSA